jgi:hypothetical protein
MPSSPPFRKRLDRSRHLGRVQVGAGDVWLIDLPHDADVQRGRA